MRNITAAILLPIASAKGQFGTRHVQEKLFGHGLFDPQGCLPPGTVTGNDIAWIASPQRFQKWRELFFRLSRQVEPAHDGENPVFTRLLTSMANGIDNTGVGTTRDNDQSFALKQHDNGGIIFEIITF